MERALAEAHGLGRMEVRRRTWETLASIVEKSGTGGLFPTWVRRQWPGRDGVSSRTEELLAVGSHGLLSSPGTLRRTLRGGSPRATWGRSRAVGRRFGAGEAMEGVVD